MPISTTLLPKALIGLGAIATVSIGGVLLNKWSKSKNSQSNQEEGEVNRTKTQTELIKEYVDSTSKNGWNLIEDKSKDPNTLSFTFDIKDGKNQQTCAIKPMVQTNIATIKNKLEEKFGSANLTEDHKRNRRGFLTKCLGQSNLELPISNEEIRMLLDFSKEELNEQELELINQDNWQVNSPKIQTENKKINVEIEITAPKSSNEISVNVCKITADKQKSEHETINETNVATIKATIEEKLKTLENKTTNRKNFLLECKRSLDKEIQMNLSEKNSESKYQIEKLDEIFNGTL